MNYKDCHFGFGRNYNYEKANNHAAEYESTELSVLGEKNQENRLTSYRNSKERQRIANKNRDEPSMQMFLERVENVPE